MKNKRVFNILILFLLGGSLVFAFSQTSNENLELILGLITIVFMIVYMLKINK